MVTNSEMAPLSQGNLPSRSVVLHLLLYKCIFDLLFLVASLKEPHACAEMSDKRDVDDELHRSHFADVVVQAVFHVVEEL